MQKAAERNKSNMEHKTKLIVRGGGDLASGVIHRLYRCGYQYWYWNVRDQARYEEKFLLERQSTMELPALRE